MITFVITVFPSILIFLYIYLSDRFREPKKLMFQVFLLGVLLIIPAGYLNQFVLKTFQNNDPVNNALLVGFFAGGFIEEILKFSILYYFVLKKNEFNEPMDGIVYGVLVSLGFATLENIEYVYLQSENLGFASWQVALLRAFSAVPLHGLVGIVMGFYFGLFAFTGQKKFQGYALIIPILFHGSYNFLISFNFLYALGALIILLVFALKLHKNLKEHQSLKVAEVERKIL